MIFSYTRERGSDLPGVQAGDSYCLCVIKWRSALGVDEGMLKKNYAIIT